MTNDAVAAMRTKKIVSDFSSNDCRGGYRKNKTPPNRILVHSSMFIIDFIHLNLNIWFEWRHLNAEHNELIIACQRLIAQQSFAE